MVAFDEYASEPVLDLERGMILLAQDQSPALREADLRAELDALADCAPDLMRFPAAKAAVVLGEYLHGECSFQGNRDDYGDPRNSYLNEVLARRTGLPITLSLVWMLVGGRLGLPVQGVGFPGHFLVRVERENLGGPLVLDPFNEGRVLSMVDLEALLHEFASAETKLTMAHLEPASARAILIRVLQNLKSAHLAKGDPSRALIVASRTLALVPHEAWALRDRGMLQAQIGSLIGAAADLTRYLEMAPKASDAGTVKKLLAQLQTKPKRTMN